MYIHSDRWHRPRGRSDSPSYVYTVHGLIWLKDRHLKNDSPIELPGESSKESFACTNDNIRTHTLQNGAQLWPVTETPRGKRVEFCSDGMQPAANQW